MAFPWPTGTIIAFAGMVIGAIIIIRGNKQAGKQANKSDMKHCANCKQDITPQRHMTGGKKAGSIIVAILVFMFGIYATTATILGGIFEGDSGPGEAAVTFIFFLLVAIAIPSVVYLTSPYACPICKTST